EVLVCVNSRRFEKPIAHGMVIACRSGYEGCHDQRVQAVVGNGLISLIAIHDGDDRRARECSDALGQAAQHELLYLSKQRVASVEQGAQRLMAGKGGAPPVPIEAQILVQEIRTRRDAMTASSSSSELDRERKSLEPSADAGHDRSTLVVQLE